MRVLLTGSNGFVGRNILPILQRECEVFAPVRAELDLLDATAVEEYVSSHKIETIIHLANPNGVKNALDKNINMTEGSLRCFMNLYRLRKKCKKIIFLGSGAEMAKTRGMHIVREEEFGEYVPEDSYGFAKYVMNYLARNSDNVYNLRLFACYGPGDHYSKFITHCIDSINNADSELTIRQECYFDYIHVFDVGNILLYFITAKDGYKYHDYNLCSGERVLLSEIAKIVKHEMQSDIPICIMKKGMNHEYTASNSRLLEEIGDYKFISLIDGIKMQIASVTSK